MNSIEIGNNIKRERKNKKLTQQELADKIGKTESSIRKYEKGLVQIPTDVLEQIASVLEVSPFNLMGADYWDLKYNADGKLATEVKLIEEVGFCFGEKAVQLLKTFESLNELGQSKALEYTTDLTEQQKYKKEAE
ncbi:helix-turn-helix domain-containing protein [Pelotomaculum terephthalicicum JT]|uniref:helix-turn-helix domain-containing protein n=1 Tax=Pelotomaculum terephthalicicum TaxID=206393 RepID=UPI001F04BFF6|nr:helix-turn-helix transcriptional regulator [Pelotomaculum terephthalicicum]MCG9969994.1 helix-turn-helix domain-containing protein [Pelotomaculum terephthalicicum JT]